MPLLWQERTQTGCLQKRGPVIEVNSFAQVGSERAAVGRQERLVVAPCSPTGPTELNLLTFHLSQEASHVYRRIAVRGRVKINDRHPVAADQNLFRVVIPMDQGCVTAVHVKRQLGDRA